MRILKSTISPDVSRHYAARIYLLEMNDKSPVPGSGLLLEEHYPEIMLKFLGMWDKNVKWDQWPDLTVRRYVFDDPSSQDTKIIIIGYKTQTYTKESENFNDDMIAVLKSIMTNYHTASFTSMSNVNHLALYPDSLILEWLFQYNDSKVYDQLRTIERNTNVILTIEK